MDEVADALQTTTDDVVMQMQDAISKKDANTKVVDELKQYLASGQTSVITSPEQRLALGNHISSMERS